MRRWLAIVALAVGCHDRPTAPPLPEAFLVVDTNVAVPGTVTRLRIDLYTDAGAWFDTRDVALPDKSAWPTSFGVYAEDDGKERTVLVRLRAYPDNHLRDYHGERHGDWSAPFAVPRGDDTPRLIVAGADVTPAQEPEPLVTIDRLVRVHLGTGAVKKTEVLLDGACFGTMAVVGDASSSASCVAEEKTTEPLSDLPESDDRTIPASKVGTWLATPCPPDLPADRICVPGGSTLVGSRDQVVPDGNSVSRPSTPVRAFGVRTFAIDRTEVSIGRVRAAYRAGFAAPPPLVNNGPIHAPTRLDDPLSCTWSEVSVQREDDPVTCWTWASSRAFCKYVGGDLPTEVQWEHAATQAGRAQKTRYPWGNDEGTCARAAAAKAVFSGDSPCSDQPLGPDGVEAHPDDATPLGILGMGGGISESVRDTYADYASPCWAGVSIADPLCEDDATVGRSWRGAAWITPLYWSTYRVGVPKNDAVLPLVGVRCVYEVPE
jgi:formylglycine-generating enzyme required for sulfatase activity